MKYLILLMLCIGTLRSLKITLYHFIGWFSGQWNVPTINFLTFLIELAMWIWVTVSFGYATILELINNH